MYFESRVCLVLLLKLLLLFEKPKANQTHWLPKVAFCQSCFSSSTKLKASPSPLVLPAVEVGNFEKITHSPPSEN